MTYGMSDFVQDLCDSKVVLPNDKLYEYFCATDAKKVKRLLGHLNRVRGVDYKALATERREFNKKGKARVHIHHAAASVKGVKSKLTGEILELILKVICQGCNIVETVTNIHTSTAEIDLLLGLGPTALAVPIFRTAGSHIIGEAKCYSSGFKAEWVNELVGLMAQHQCSHSLLFVASPSKGLRADHRHGLHIHSIKGKHVVPFGLRQMNEVANGSNFLAVLNRQYVQVQTASNHLSI